MNFNSLRKEIYSKNVSVKELTKDFFLKIDSKDPKINSYICTTKDNAIRQAEYIDKLIQMEKYFLHLQGSRLQLRTIFALRES